MNTTSRAFVLPAGVVLAWLLAGVSGCGPSFTDLCERAADCASGRDLEIEACVVYMDAREEEADIFSCADEWEDYVDCLDDKGSCDTDHHTLAGCSSDLEALNNCISDRRAGHARIELKSGE